MPPPRSALPAALALGTRPSSAPPSIVERLPNAPPMSLSLLLRRREWWQLKWRQREYDDARRLIVVFVLVGAPGLSYPLRMCMLCPLS